MDALRPFWEVDPENLDDVTGTLIERGRPKRTDDGSFELTAAGRAAHTAADTVGRLREPAATDIADEDYVRMMDTRQRIIDNLERAADRAVLRRSENRHTRSGLQVAIAHITTTSRAMIRMDHSG